MIVGGFDWDAGNRGKCCKHGVSLDEIEHVLVNSPKVTPDLAHSDVEDRFIAVGRTPGEGRLVFVAFTLRERDETVLIRPVSARYMHEKEARTYEEDSA